MTSFLFKNALILTMNHNNDIVRGNILVENDHIQHIGTDEIGCDEVIDASGMVIIPGLIDTHAHVAMTHLRGMLDDLHLDAFLEKTFSLDSERTENGIFNSSLLGMYQMIDAGITSFHDLYYDENVIERAALQTGIRSFLSWVTLDPEYTTQSGDPVKNAESFITGEKHETVGRSIGVQGIYVTSKETYDRVREIAEKYGTTIHTHLSETRKEVYDSVKKNGKRPIEYLHQIGFLSSRVIAAHCVWSTMREVRLLAGDGVKVSWNPVSNAKLGVGGMPPVPEMLQQGIHVSIGTDSASTNNSLDVMNDLKFGTIAMKNQRWDASLLGANRAIEMCTREAALSLNRTDIGSIEEGKKADLVILDNLRPDTLMKPDTLISDIVYSWSRSWVRSVMINGKFVKRDWKVKDFDPNYFLDCEFV